MKQTFVLICVLLGLAGCATPFDPPEMAGVPIEDTPVFEEPIIEARPAVFHPGGIGDPAPEDTALIDEIRPECTEGGIGGTGCKID